MTKQKKPVAKTATKQAAARPQGTLIDMSKVLTLVLTYPDNMVPMELALWFMRMGFRHNQIGTCCERGFYDVVRNKAVQSLATMLDKYEWLLMIDNDMRPYGATDMFLMDQRAADVVACNYETANKAAMVTPDAFHMGLLRVRTAKMLEVIAAATATKKPLFAFPRNDSNTQVLACECAYFGYHLKQAKATVVRIGHCNHGKAANHVCKGN